MFERRTNSEAPHSPWKTYSGEQNDIKKLKKEITAVSEVATNENLDS